jgi:hypothetical protein
MKRNGSMIKKPVPNSFTIWNFSRKSLEILIAILDKNKPR